MQGYIPRRPLKEIQQRFKRDGFTSVDQFINDNFRLETVNDLVNMPAYVPPTSSPNNTMLYLNDDGNGRISKGLLSLEAITKTLKGVPAGAMVLFDQIIYSNPYDFITLTFSAARSVVIDNLGITPFLFPAQSVGPSTITELNKMADRMVLDIKNGTFTAAKYKNQALSVCKSVVKAAMNYKAI